MSAHSCPIPVKPSGSTHTVGGPASNLLQTCWWDSLQCIAMYVHCAQTLHCKWLLSRCSTQLRPDWAARHRSLQSYFALRCTLPLSTHSGHFWKVLYPAWYSIQYQTYIGKLISLLIWNKCGWHDPKSESCSREQVEVHISESKSTSASTIEVEVDISACYRMKHVAGRVVGVDHCQ